MDKKIEAYINEIVEQLNCAVEKKRDIADEMSDHLHLLKREYIAQGLPDEMAGKKALASFGKQKQLTKGLQKELSPFYKLYRIGIWTLFCTYLAISLFLLLLQRITFRLTDYYINGETFNRYVFTPSNAEGYFDYLKFNVSYIPFKSTYEYLTGATSYNLDIIINNTLGNILVFLPLGFFLPLLFKSYNKFAKIVAASAIMSFSVEVLQISLKIGRFDVDDVILNTVGAIIGFFMIRFIISVMNMPKRSFIRRIVN